MASFIVKIVQFLASKRWRDFISGALYSEFRRQAGVSEYDPLLPFERHLLASALQRKRTYDGIPVGALIRPTADTREVSFDSPKAGAQRLRSAAA
jgi:hypothetical protein